MNAMTTSPLTFGALVLRYREARNMSQDRLAQLAGLSNGYISLLEQGRRGKNPSRDTVIRIAQALNAPLAEMLGAAGRLKPGEDLSPEQRASFEDFVQTDPSLTTQQKGILIDLYSSWVKGTV